MASEITGEQRAHAPAPRIASFSEFWPFYVREHSRSATRALHFVGSTVVLAIVATAIVTGRPWLLVATPLAGYGFAWVGHFAFEKNRPATFKYPVWSFLADWVMYAKILSGTMRGDLERVLPRNRP